MTHLLDGCVAAKALGTRDAFSSSHTAQLAKFSQANGGAPWAPEALSLLSQSMEAAHAAWLEDYKP